MSSYMIGDRVKLGDEAEAICRMGSGPPEPGWYLHVAWRGVRTEEPEAGPFPDLGGARRMWQLLSAERRHLCLGTHATLMADGSVVFPMRAVQGPHPKMFGPLVILNAHRIFIARTARVDAFTKFEGGQGIVIGEHVHVASFAHIGIGGGLTILEDKTSFSSGTRVISGSNVYGEGHGCSAVAPDSKFERSFVHIRRNATLFAGAIVLPGVTVGENSVLAAGAVANRDIPDGELWAGVPAKFVKRIGGAR